MKATFVVFMGAITLACGFTNSSVTDFYIEEVRSLSELPLDKLIRIKSSFSKRNMDDEYQVAESRSPLPSPSALSLPLTMASPGPGRRVLNGGRPQPIRRYDEWEEKGKDSKISKIFQLTLSALSFLAFGGYLLTLIITAIRRNQNMTASANVIVLSNLVNRFKRPKRGVYVYNPDDNDYDTERLYRGMIMLSSDFRSQYGR